MRTGTRVTLTVSAMVTCVIAASAQEPGNAHKLARDILEYAGVKGGIVAHVG